MSLAGILEAEADELLILADKIPETLRQRVFQRPEIFRELAPLDDEDPDRLVKNLDKGAP